MNYISIPTYSDARIKAEIGINGLGRENETKSVYARVVDEILAIIREKKYLPWQQPWKAPVNKKGDRVYPNNFKTGNNYSGVNYLILATTMQARRIKNPFFLTFKQIEEMKGTLKKGSKSIEITYYQETYVNQNAKKKFLNRAEYMALPADQKKEYSKSLILKAYRVFSLDDTEGIKYDLSDLDFEPKVTEKQKIEAAEKVIENYPNKPRIVEIPSDEAYYSSGIDEIVMPDREQFKTLGEFYCTLFHEAIHSTGHKNRLKRTFGQRFGDEDYSQEELVAEIGASFICTETNIEYNRLQSAAYINGWAKQVTDLLSEDPKNFFKAAADAQKAVNYIYGMADEAVYEGFTKDKVSTTEKPQIVKNQEKALKLLALKTITIKLKYNYA